VNFRINDAEIFGQAELPVAVARKVEKSPCLAFSMSAREMEFFFFMRC